jgi:hypothetical protein
MLVLLEQSHSGLTVRHASGWDRVTIWCRGARLDRALAAGASPDASVPLALRARALVRSSVRRDLAHSVGRVLDLGTRRVALGRWTVPVCLDRVGDAAGELRSLIDHLASPGPVSARGVAQVRVLLRDGSGPLYNRANTDDLRARLRTSIEALDPLDPR